jgi:hypothetical protein
MYRLILVFPLLILLALPAAAHHDPGHPGGPPWLDTPTATTTPTGTPLPTATSTATPTASPGIWSDTSMRSERVTSSGRTPPGAPCGSRPGLITTR